MRRRGKITSEGVPCRAKVTARLVLVLVSVSVPVSVLVLVLVTRGCWPVRLRERHALSTQLHVQA